MDLLLPIKIEISINGAYIFPTSEQYDALKVAVNNILLGGEVVEAQPVAELLKLKKAGRPKGVRNKPRHRHASWLPEEIAMLKARRLEGVKLKKVIKEINNIYGNNRTTGAASSMLYLTKNEVKADPNELVGVSDLPPAKANEWGGTDGLKSQIA